MKPIDLPRKMANHLIGQNHTPLHRRIFGAAIMAFGTGLALGFHSLGSAAFSFIGDMLGLSFHGFGLGPFLQWMEKYNK